MIKTVSLETAKLLKGTGFPQHNIHFKWAHGIAEPFILVTDLTTFKDDIICAAPTTDELLEELPFQLDSNQGFDCIYRIQIRKDAIYKQVDYVNETHCLRGWGICENESLPEALAQMWLWLKKEGLLESRP